MSGKMNWSRAGKLYRRMTTDFRYESDVPDRAQRWIDAVERNRRARQRNKQSGQGKLNLRPKITANSTEGVPR